MKARWMAFGAAALVAFGCGEEEIPDVEVVPEYPTYVEHIRPFLAQHCLLCHGERPRNGAPSRFRLDVYEDVGGKLGARSMAEAMAEILERGAMPPTGAGVGPNARKMFRRCADLGAPERPCTPSCAGRMCGDDGCGGVCGECADGQICDEGVCVGCEPQCAGRECGDDGCGGSCGTCPADFICTEGACISDEESSVSLALVWEEVIAVHCLECHGPGEGGLTMGSTPASFRTAVVDRPSGCGGRVYVVPGDPDQSYLMDKVEGRPGICGRQMPYLRPPLTTSEMELLRKWIADGAPAN